MADSKLQISLEFKKLMLDAVLFGKNLFTQRLLTLIQKWKMFTLG